MTHTEESLMALALDAVALAYPGSHAQIDAYDSAIAALRLAIREVLAERDEARKSDGWQWVDSARADRQAAVSQWRAANKRAEKAEAECERLRKDAERLDYIEKHARCDPKMDGHHVWWPTTFKNALRGCNLREAIDAAIKDQP